MSLSSGTADTDAAARIALIMSTVRDLNDLAENSYTFARQQLAILGESGTDLPLGIVDVDIGTDTTITWDGSYIVPTSPVEPDYTDTIDSPIIPTFTAPAPAAGSIPEWAESAPIAPSAPAVPGAGTKPELSITSPVVPPVTDAVTPGTQPVLSVTDPTIPAVGGSVTVGAQPTLSIDDPTVPDVTVNTDSAPTWSVDLGGAPGALVPAVFSDLPILDPLPAIDVVIPTMDVSLLLVDPADDFVEPQYVERVSTEVEAAIKSVLGGDLGLPAGYWDSLWAQAATDIAQQVTAESRHARNRGAASHWALPSEVVLINSRRIQEEGSKKLTLAKLEQSKAAAVYAREDFWQAVSKGIEYENQWILANDRVAQRALAAAEQIYSVRVQVHNANISRYNSMLDAAKLDGTIDDMQAKLVLAKLDGELKSSAQEIARAGHALDEYKTRWEGYRIDKTTTITAMAEQIKFWNSQVDGDIRYQSLGMEGAKVSMELVRTKVQAFSADIQAWLGSIDADVKYQGLEVEAGKLGVDLMRAKVQQFGEEVRAWLGAVDANVKYQQLGFEGTKLDLQFIDSRIRLFSEDLRGWLGGLDATTKTEGLVLEAAKVDFQGFESKARVFASEVQAWTAASSTDVQYQNVVQGYSKLEIDLMAEQVKQVQGLAAATANMLQARTGASKFEIDKQLQPHNIDRDKNAAELERSKITQAAQAARAKIDVAQAQWTLGQDIGLKTNMAQLAYGYAQAAVTASDVGISSSTNTSVSDSETASHNAERVW